jgi:hypothetical protein
MKIMTELPIILNDLIEKELQNKIEDAMFDCNWLFKMDNTYDYNVSSMGMKYRKFLNPFEYDISPSIITNLQVNQKIFKLFNPIIKKTCNHINFNLEQISRCIAGIQGVQVIRKQNKVCNIHINQRTPHLVLLYYVNDADGETLLFDKTIDDIKDDDVMYLDERHEFNAIHKIMPKQGRILLFDGRTYHSASSPTTGIRCIITLDLFGEFVDGSYKFPIPEKETIKNNFMYQ